MVVRHTGASVLPETKQALRCHVSRDILSLEPTGQHAALRS
jgi:hypothetical protein